MTRLSSHLVLSALCLGAFSAAAGAEPTLRPYAFEARSGETVDAQWGEFQVPESRRQEGGKTLTLAFVRFPSTSAHPGPPIVYLAGGPGGSGIGTARGSRFPIFQALRKYGDVIAFDQRGTGESEPRLVCDAPATPIGRASDRAELTAIVQEAARRCAAKIEGEGWNLGAYNTVESADDLDDLRQALGAEKITLWGISYGTHLALATLKRHGEHIDRVLLAGIEGLDHSLKLPSDQQDLLETIARLSAADPAVRAVIPDLLASVQRVLTRLEEKPATVPLPDPASGQPVPLSVSRYDFQMALAGMLGGPQSFAGLPDFVARLERGDDMALALWAIANRIGYGMLPGMSVAMDCASGASRPWRERIAKEAASTLLGDAINFPFPEICEGLGVRDLGDEFRAPVRSTVPALLISGTLDGRTPPSNAEEVLPGLSRAIHLIIEGAGHSDPLFLSSPEILAAMERFLAGQELESTRIQLPPISFIAPRKIAPVELETLERYVGTYRLPDGGTRRVFLAGGLLLTQRGEGRPLPIRPTSPTTFFYEGSPTHLRFQVDAEGRAERMVVFHEGAADGETAVRIE